MAKKGRLIALASAGGAALVLALLAVPIYERALEAWLLGKLDSGDTITKEKFDAAWRLGELGSLRAIEPLLLLVVIVRRPYDLDPIHDALDKIVARRGLDAVRRIAAGLDETSPEVRSAAARSLARAGPAVAPIVPEFIATVRRQSGPEPAALGELLRDQQQSAAYPAACRLGQMGVSGLPHIVDALDDPKSSVRWLALHALLGLGPEGWAAAPRATELLLDPDIAVREHARSALAGMKVDLKARGR